jgi:hypothetical protein
LVRMTLTRKSRWKVGLRWGGALRKATVLNGWTAFLKAFPK